MSLETSLMKTMLLFLGTLIPFTEEKKVCPFSEIVQLQNSLYKNSDQNYFPRESCFVCAKPSVDDHIKGSIEKEIVFGPIPLYNGMIEFGLLGIDFPDKAFLFIQLNDKCYFKAQITRDEIKNEGLLEFYICFDNYANCPKLYGRYTYKNFKYDSTCVFLSFWMENPAKIHYAASRGCFAPSTNVFKEHETIEIGNQECTENPYSHFHGTFIFEEADTTFYDGISLLMPCTPGGYSVDPNTGRFGIGDYCERVFWYSKSDPESGLDYIIKEFFNSTEDLKFPALEKTAEESNYKPIFIGEDELPKPSEEMIPKIEKNMEMSGKERRGCEIVESEYDLDQRNLNDIEGRRLKFSKDDPSDSSTVSDKKMMELKISSTENQSESSMSPNLGIVGRKMISPAEIAKTTKEAEQETKSKEQQAQNEDQQTTYGEQTKNDKQPTKTDTQQTTEEQQTQGSKQPTQSDEKQTQVSEQQTQSNKQELSEKQTQESKQQTTSYSQSSSKLQSQSHSQTTIEHTSTESPTSYMNESNEIGENTEKVIGENYETINDVNKDLPVPELRGVFGEKENNLVIEDPINFAEPAPIPAKSKSIVAEKRSSNMGSVSQAEIDGGGSSLYCNFVAARSMIASIFICFTMHFFPN